MLVHVLKAKQSLLHHNTHTSHRPVCNKIDQETYGHSAALLVWVVEL